MRLIAALAAMIVIASCSVFREPAPVVDGWRYPAPAPLPPGATAVRLDVTPIPGHVPANTSFGCPLALLGPTTISYVAADVEHPVHYRAVQTGEELRLRWQPGVSARITDRLEIVGPDGKVLAREGEGAENLGGGVSNDDVFTVCFGEYLPTRVGQ